ncbi:Pycsar system effector family protein [Pseudomonadota bacterium]
MSTEQRKIDLLLDAIKRFDGYMVSTNTKASVILAFNSFMLGTVFIKFNDIVQLYQGESYQLTAMVALTLINLCSITSLAFVFCVVYPYLGKQLPTNSPNRSLFFFKDIASISTDEYIQSFNTSQDETIRKDLSSQVHTLAVGLNNKMMLMRRSVQAILTGLSIILILVILLFCSATFP